jgi:hypothetical protein
MPGLGTDYSCDPWGGLSPSLAVVSPETAYVQAIARRLTTRRGGLWYDPTYGLDVRDYLLDVATDAQIAAEVSGQVMLDERTRDCSVSVRRPTLGALELTILVTTATGATYPMTLHVSQATGVRLITQDPEAGP